MSGGSADKTEKPTPKRIQDARKQGQVAKSQDFNGAMVLIAATMMMGMVGPYAYGVFYNHMRSTFETLGQVRAMTLDSFNGLLTETIYALVMLMLPILLGVMVVAILSNLLMVRPLLAIDAIKPKLDKINPLNGFKRLWSMRSIIEVVKAILKMVLIGACAWSIIQSHLGELMSLMLGDMITGWAAVFGVLGKIAVWSAIIFIVMGILDWRYQAWQLEKQLRMTRQEIKDERKNQDGDPMIKSRIRQMGIQMSRNRQLAQVPTADVVITNPTHFAIALKYDPDVSPAPFVIAKGKDHFALKIKERAKEHGVPTVENKPLARALYAMVEVDAMIAPELFVAVAEVLAFVFAKNKGRGLKRKKSSTQARPL